MARRKKFKVEFKREATGFTRSPGVTVTAIKRRRPRLPSTLASASPMAGRARAPTTTAAALATARVDCLIAAMLPRTQELNK